MAAAAATALGAVEISCQKIVMNIRDSSWESCISSTKSKILDYNEKYRAFAPAPGLAGPRMAEGQVFDFEQASTLKASALTLKTLPSPALHITNLDHNLVIQWPVVASSIIKDDPQYFFQGVITRTYSNLVLYLRQDWKRRGNYQLLASTVQTIFFFNSSI
ncbi:hypothetical protein DL96DRAFT_1554425 [Flagelloscypha sp. PMI_526]|nr:hypothetical protein DL96DRAFT_1554425 [Flagelloscypha sp. PMI_526]